MIGRGPFQLTRSTLSRTAFERGAVQVGDVAKDPSDGCRVAAGVERQDLKRLRIRVAMTSLSWMRLKPSIAEPSKVIPSSSASRARRVIETVFGMQSTSVNHSCTKRTARSRHLQHVFR